MNDTLACLFAVTQVSDVHQKAFRARAISHYRTDHNKNLLFICFLLKPTKLYSQQFYRFVDSELLASASLTLFRRS